MLNWILGMTTLSQEVLEQREIKLALGLAVTDATNFSRDFSYLIVYKRITNYF